MNSIWKRFSSRSTNRRTGASLIEAIISAGIMGIIMTCVYALMGAGVRYLHATNAAVELQQQSLLAMMGLTHDIGESNPRTVRLFPPEDPGILMGSPRSDTGETWVDPSGQVRWAKFLAYYLDDVNGVKCLLKKEQYMDDPDLHTDPPPLLPPIPQPWQVVGYYRMLEIPPRVIARNVQKLTFQGVNPVQIGLTVGKKDYGRTFQIRLSVKVSMKN
jgi:hypothetical protein